MPGPGRRLRWWVDGEPTPLLRALMDAPDRVLASSRSVAREQGGRKRFYRVDGDEQHPAYFVKVFNLPPGPGRLRYLARRSKARVEADVARRVRERGFDAPQPLAVGEERCRGALVRSIAVVPGLPAVDLREKLREPGLEPAARRALIEELGRLNRALHEAGIDQDDTAPNNFLVRDDGGLVLIDFERCALRGGPLPHARRMHLLAKLQRHEVRASRTDRLAFLAAYLGDASGREGRRRAWRSIREHLLRLRRHDARRAGRAAFKLGRHLERDGDAWQVRARAGETVISRALDPAGARCAWVRAHQLERLALPALRPVRLEGARIDLLRPAGLRDGAPDAGAVRTAERAMRPFGRFEGEPRWLDVAGRAWLGNPECFRPR